MAGHNPSRQFRDKEYVEFDVTTTSSPSEIKWSIDYSSFNPNPCSLSTVRTDYGNGEIEDKTIGVTNYSWPLAGSYEMKIWAREGASAFSSFMLEGIPAFNGSIGDVNLSNWNYVTNINLNDITIASLTMPTSHAYPSTAAYILLQSVAGLGANYELDVSGYNNYGITDYTLTNSTVGGVVTGANQPNSLSKIIWSDFSQDIRYYGPSGTPSGTIDLSNHTITANAEINLTSKTSPSIPVTTYSTLIWPTTTLTGNIGDLRLQGSNLTSLDFSSINIYNNTGSSFEIWTHDSLTSIVQPSVTQGQYLGKFDLRYLPLITSLNISNLSVNLNFLLIHDCDVLATLTMPSNPLGTFDLVRVSFCPLLGYIDITTMPKCSDKDNCDIQLQSNSWTTAIVNQVLVDLDTISSGGYIGRQITIDGTNAAPDGTSGGYDGLTAKANLITKGFTVTTN
tara:strand:- start:319 stop:1671 length:1353 start_codon:yes stop_codon:yes gene_type:complete